MSGDENRFFPVGNTTQGNPCFHYRDGFAVKIPVLGNFQYICQNSRCRKKTVNKRMPIIGEMFSSRIFSHKFSSLFLLATLHIRINFSRSIMKVFSSLLSEST